MKRISALFIILFLSYLHANENASLYFYGNCSTCHANGTSLSAPSITEVKARYLSAFIKKEDFVQKISAWVYKPNQTDSLMHDAIEKYGLMPELAIDLETLKVIGEYIYETDFDAASTSKQ